MQQRLDQRGINLDFSTFPFISNIIYIPSLGVKVQSDAHYSSKKIISHNSSHMLPWLVNSLCPRAVPLDSGLFTAIHPLDRYGETCPPLWQGPGQSRVHVGTCVLKESAEGRCMNDTSLRLLTSHRI